MCRLAHGCVPTETPFPAQKAAPLVHTLETTAGDPLQAIERPNRSKSQEKCQAAAIWLYSHLENNPGSSLFHGDRDPYKKRSYKLSRCRKFGFFARHKETGLVEAFRSSCKIRWCPLCGSALVSWRTHSCSEWLVRLDRPKFATYTVQHTDESLDSQVKSLYLYLRYLRQLRNFRKYVRGGIWFPQIKRSSGDGLWHPHAHCLLDSTYYPPEEFHADWQKSSRGSYVADIREVRDNTKVVNDVVRYSAYPGDLAALSLDDAVTVYRAFHGKRLCGTWGTAKGVQLKPPRDEHPELWEWLSGISIVLGLCNSNADAKAIYEAYRDHTVLAAGVSIKLTDDIVQFGGYYRRGVQGESDAQLLSSAKT